MGLRRTWGAAAAAAVAGAVLVTLTPSGGSEARWRDGASTTVSGPSSDTFGMTATDVPDDAITPWPSGRMATSPQVTLTNHSASHSGWVNIQSTRVDRVVAESAGSAVQGMSLAYTLGTGTCGDGGQGGYWQARNAGQITPGATYTRTQTKVAGATVEPGQGRTLCPVVGFSTGATQTLLNHAGRAFDITTVVNQRSESPATWSSPPRTITSRFRLAMPPPVKPSASPVCRTTNLSGNPEGLITAWGGFFWGWPNAESANYTSPPSTKAMAGGWEILRRNSDGSWETWATASADQRRSAGHNSNRISDDEEPWNAVREFKLRGYPFANNKSSYVESDWIARAYESRPLLLTYWNCATPRINPDAGPHNMP